MLSRSLALLPALVLLCSVTLRADQPAYPHAREISKPMPLDQYVATPDPHYAWELVRTEQEDGVTAYTIDLTSQKWRSESEVDKPVWKHWLTVCVPESVEHDTALMFIEGGSNRNRAEPRRADRRMIDIARQTRTVTGAIYMIPNQPLVFQDAFGWGRSEDAMIAYTWDKFYRTGDPTWLARFPMTKAVVRAMDTLQAFSAGTEAGGHEVNDFVVAGGSKRGWTTWTTAMVDNRVKAIIPAVIDVLNVIESFRHHYRVYGAWSVAVGDYQALRILDWLDTPENAEMMRHIDPINHLDRLTMPKYVMNAGNDQFFVPDSSRFYWDQLKGPKWLRYVPNSGHNIGSSDAYATLAAFYHAIAADLPIPEYNFAFEDDGAIVVTIPDAASAAKLTEVKLWKAHNPEKRDFRGAKASYVSSPVAEVDGAYRAVVEMPEKGWISYFIELTFAGPAPETPFKFTSGVRSMPDTTAFEYAPPAKQPQGFISQQQLTQ